MTAAGHLHYFCGPLHYLSTIKIPLARCLDLCEKRLNKLWSFWGFVIYCTTMSSTLRIITGRVQHNITILSCWLKALTEWMRVWKVWHGEDTLCFLDFLLSSSSEWWWCLFSLCFFSECRWLDSSSSSSISKSYLELSGKLWKSPAGWESQCWKICQI